VEPGGHEITDRGHLMPCEIVGDFSGGSAVDSNVIAVDRSSNGLPTSPFAADAANVRSKLDEAIRLLDAADVVGARAVIFAAMLELDNGRH
jgi:hypothetical protein